MNLKTKVLIGIIACASVFAAGRFSAPEKIKTVTIEIEKKTTTADTTKEVHRKITTIERPDGTRETIVTEDTTSENKSSTTDDKSLTSSKEITKGSNTTILALVGVDFSTPGIMYGASISRPVLGPISIGVWALTNKTAGLGIGLAF